MKSLIRYALVVSLLALLLSACAVDAGDPADAVEAYITAMADGDADSMIVVSCADWEEQARISAQSFETVEATLNNVSCETLSEEGEAADVTCEGSISVSYEGESRELPVSERVFHLIKQGGNWLVCGQD